MPVNDLTQASDPERSEFLSDFADRWLAAWNSHDTAQVLELLHEDIVFDDRVFWPDVICGREAMNAYVEKIWQSMPDVCFTEIERFFSPDLLRAVVLFRQTGHGPAQLNPDKTFEQHGCDIFLRFADGKLAHYLSAYDIVGMLEQLQALPARGTRLGGAYVMSLLGAKQPERP
jgi:steroid delta-isomerase-like uncharacterized protein